MSRSRYTRELLIEAARQSTSLAEAVRRCGGTPTRGAMSYLRERLLAEDIDTFHFSDARVRHTEARLRQAVSQSCSTADVVRRLGISPVGGNRAHIGRRIAKLGIDTSHFTTVGTSRPKGALGDRLVVGNPADGRVPGERLRRELLRREVPEQCVMCGTGTEWNGKPLCLEVDHINGQWWDNRPENLRMLCPNCHTVTDTYRGRKVRRIRSEP